MTRNLRLTRQRWLADGVVELELRDPSGAELPAWEPGAHVTVALPGGVSRDYSLCGAPGDRSQWTIAVLREPASRGGSSYIHERLRVGDRLDVSGPRNNFPLADGARFLLLAGGIGITPIKAMADRLAAEGADWSLTYCGRSRAGMAFLPELTALASERLTVHADDDHGGPPDLAALLAAQPDGTQVYCCGPEPLLAAVERLLPAGLDLHLERFRAAPAPASAVAADSAFEVVCAGSGTTVRVETGVSILDALDTAGVDVPSSCREGICGSCETKVLDGEPDHRDQVLTAEEQAQGQTMMLCVSRCRGSRLVLDLA